MIGDAWLRTPAAPFLAGCVLLTGIIGVEWLPEAAHAPTPVSHNAHAPSQAAKPDDARDTGEWSDTILERPLFSISHKPAKIEAGPGKSAAAMPRLAGIMISAYGKRAIFMPDGGKPMVLAEGATVNSSIIRHISPDSVTLGGPDGNTVLRPTLDKQRPNIGPATGTSPFLPGAQPGGFPQGVPFNPSPPPPPNDDNADNGDNTPPPPPPQRMQPMRPPFLQPGGPGAPAMRGQIVPRGRDE